MLAGLHAREAKNPERVVGEVTRRKRKKEKGRLRF
jgi:hypothetical protein